jgi:hypothetical protein
MADDFPGLQAVLGNRRFEALSKAYLVDCPSHSFTLRNLGRDLESWLKKNPRWAGSRQSIALDMVAWSGLTLKLLTRRPNRR